MAPNVQMLLFYTQTALSGFVAIVCLLFTTRKVKTTNLIGLLFFVGFICNVWAYLFLLYGNGRAINIPGSVYDLCLIVILGLLYSHITHNVFRKLFGGVTLLYLVFAVLNLFLFQKTDISSYNKLLSSFIVIFYAIFYFYRLMVEMPTTHIQRLPMFWFNSAFLIYHAGTIFLFAFTSYLTDVLKSNLLIYWNFHNSLSIFEHFLILVGLYFHKLHNSEKAH